MVNCTHIYDGVRIGRLAFTSDSFLVLVSGDPHARVPHSVPLHDPPWAQVRAKPLSVDSLSLPDGGE